MTFITSIYRWLGSHGLAASALGGIIALFTAGLSAIVTFVVTVLKAGLDKRQAKRNALRELQLKQLTAFMDSIDALGRWYAELKVIARTRTGMELNEAIRAHLLKQPTWHLDITLMTTINTKADPLVFLQLFTLFGQAYLSCADALTDFVNSGYDTPLDEEPYRQFVGYAGSLYKVALDMIFA